MPTEYEVDHRLLPLPKEAAQVYSPGRHLIFTKNPSDLTEGYQTNDISFSQVSPPALTETMQDIWAARMQQQYPQGVKRNGELIGLRTPINTEGVLSLPIFLSNFLDWKMTLPWGDQYDTKLDATSLRPPLDMHHAVVTADNKLLYVTRGNNRETWNQAVLGFHSYGHDKDKTPGARNALNELISGQGYSLFTQARDGIRREINPFTESGNPDVPNTVLEELVKPEDVTVTSATCLTLHIKPRDFGYHVCFAAKVNKEAGQLLEMRNKYPMAGRISAYYAHPFTESGMAEFFQTYHERIATTIEPALIMLCVQQFGEDFLKALPFEARRQK